MDIIPNVIKISAKLNVNQWNSFTWKSIKSGTALKKILSYRLPIAPQIINEKKNFSWVLDLNIRNNKTNMIIKIRIDNKL